MPLPIFDISSVGRPLQSPNGETIWELAGRFVEGTTDRHSTAEVVLAPGSSTLNHFHPEAEESYYILKGRGRMIIDGEEASVGPGQAIYIAPNRAHKLVNTGPGELRLLAICVPAWEPANTVWLEKWRVDSSDSAVTSTIEP